MVGEKFLPPILEGDMCVGDTSFFSDDFTITIGRFAGSFYPLASSPEDPRIHIDCSPRCLECYVFGSYHATGMCHFVFGDGSVHKIHPSINTTLLGRLANRRDGQPIPDTWQR